MDKKAIHKQAGKRIANPKAYAKHVAKLALTKLNKKLRTKRGKND